MASTYSQWIRLEWLTRSYTAKDRSTRQDCGDNTVKERTPQRLRYVYSLHHINIKYDKIFIKVNLKYYHL